MSLGYNEDFSDALKEILEYRYFGGSPSNDEFDKLVEELRECRNTFQREIEAYRLLHESYNEGESPESILEQIKKLTPITEEYHKV